MKVRISYPTEVDKVSKKVVDLLNDDLEYFNSIAEQLRLVVGLLNLNKDESAEHASHLLDTVRKELAELDGFLASTQSVLNGYIQIINSEDLEQGFEADTVQEPSGE